MRPNGLQPEIRNVISCRKRRFNYLKRLFCQITQDLKKADSDLETFLPMDERQYMDANRSPNRSSIQDVWLQYSMVYEKIALGIMQTVYAERCYRMDGTMKIGKRAFIVQKNKKHVTPEEVTVMIVVVNEIGQWLYFAFREVENKSALSHAVEKCAEAQERNRKTKNVAIVIDNAEAYRNTIREKFPEATVRQDPWHVINRFNAYAAAKQQSVIQKELANALYKGKGILRPVSEMAQKFQVAVEKLITDGAFKMSQIEKVRGTLNYNLNQIRKGDLSAFLPSKSKGLYVFNVM
jgi:hypothetical protein